MPTLEHLSPFKTQKHRSQETLRSFHVVSKSLCSSHGVAGVIGSLFHGQIHAMTRGRFDGTHLHAHLNLQN